MHRDVRFAFPDPVVDLSPREREAVWQAAGWLMRAVGIGSSIRSLIPIRLSGEASATFGAWIGVHPEVLEWAIEIEDGPDYADFGFEGVLANRLPPWGSVTFGKLVEAEVLELDSIPYVTGSADPELARILTTEWPHDDVLYVLP